MNNNKRFWRSPESIAIIFKSKVMRAILKYTEQRKQDLIFLAQYSANTTVIGVYYPGCMLVKYVLNGKTKLVIT